MTHMENFLWFFVEKPFQDVIPWFAAPFYEHEGKCIQTTDDPGFLKEFETDEEYFKRVGRSRETAKAFPFQYRLLEVSPGDDFCMVESNLDVNSDPWKKLIARGCSSPLFKFRVVSRKEGIELVEFHVTDWWHRSRGVLAHRSENDPSRWEFNQKGKPETWEELSRYEARRVCDRLTPELLVNYALKAFGVNVNRLFTRQFSRVASIVDAPLGEPLEQYKPYFEDILERRIYPR